MSDTNTPVTAPANPYDAIVKEFSELKATIADLKRPVQQVIEIKSNHEGQLTAPKLFAQSRDQKEEMKFGWQSFGHFAKGVCKYYRNLGGDPRFEKVEKAAQGMGEALGSDGGHLVPPVFSMDVFERVYANDLLSRTDQYTTAGDSMVFLANAETSRVDGSRYGGARAYWLDEGSSITKSKPTLRRLKLNLHKLATLAAVTEELLADSAISLEQYLSKTFVGEITFQVGAAIVRGTGSGKPTGLLESGCAISVSKETGQAAATIVYENIINMFARLWAPSMNNAVWLINQDTLPQLHQMTINVGTGGMPVYLPPGGVSGSPYATLMGRPVIVSEFPSTLGTVGDIILTDLSQYITLTKGGMETAVSMHLYFDTAEMAFRTTYRVDGQSWWNQALTPYQGTVTKSPIILLATRS